MESGKYEDLIIMIKMNIATPPIIAKTLAATGFAPSVLLAAA
jgi:hypothetical protein